MSHLFELQPDSAVSYIVAVLFPALDAILPVVPSESIIVTLGVATAGSFDPRLFLIVLLAVSGAFIGDNLCYLIGRHFGPWFDRKAFSSERGSRHRKWAKDTLERFGARLIIVCRFIPGGRTVVTFTCGAVGYPWRRFLPATVVSGAIWAMYAFVIGRIGGTIFASKPWMGLILALGAAFTVSLIAEFVRRIASWRRRFQMKDSTVCREGTSQVDGVRA